MPVADIMSLPDEVLARLPVQPFARVPPDEAETGVLRSFIDDIENPGPWDKTRQAVWYYIFQTKVIWSTRKNAPLARRDRYMARLRRY